ncbi:MAG TPA: hypothetical protein VHZ07_22580 [Bryobacteraceae bacterium]|nr:hypothetical protein [Bryobacteraceae bacterium]
MADQDDAAQVVDIIQVLGYSSEVLNYQRVDASVRRATNCWQSA